MTSRNDDRDRRNLREKYESQMIGHRSRRHRYLHGGLDEIQPVDYYPTRGRVVDTTPENRFMGLVYDTVEDISPTYSSYREDPAGLSNEAIVIQNLDPKIDAALAQQELADANYLDDVSPEKAITATQYGIDEDLEQNHQYFVETLPIGNLTGGGAWAVWSNENDSTVDAIYQHFGSDPKNLALTQIKKGLGKVYAEADTELKNSNKNKSAIVCLQHNVNYAYTGVVIGLLVSMAHIPLEYLKRALSDSYRDYIRTWSLKDASGWRSYKERLDAVAYEIRALSYAIQKGTPLALPDKYIDSDGKTDMSNVKKYLNKLQKDGVTTYIDKIYLVKTRAKVPLYMPKNSAIYEPLLDAQILNLGIVMEGAFDHVKKTQEQPMLRKYYVVTQKGTKRTWKLFDTFTDTVTGLVPSSVLEDIFGSNLKFY
jgi:hypothetical protein